MEDKKEQEKSEIKEKITTKEKVKIISKVFLFAIIGVIIAVLITPIFVPKWANEHGGMARRMGGIYEEPKDTIDVVMIGNSDMYNGISTIYLWKNAGIASYHIGSPMQTTWTSYYLLKEFYKNQSPKLAIIEADYIFEKKDRSEPNVRQVFDSMELSKNKIDAINDPAYHNSLSRKLTYIIPLFRYHSRWDELNKRDLKEAYIKYEVPFKGYELTKSIKPYKEENDKKEKKKTTKIPEKSKKYLDKVIELCRENNTEVLLIGIPSAKSWTPEKSELVSEYAKENDVTFIDYNLLDFDWSKYTRDEGSHLNVWGAEKITKDLQEELKKYNLPDHRNEQAYEKWNESLEIYENLKAK